MPVAVPPPLLPPTSPLIVRRRFRAVAPYAAGGRRAISLGASRRGSVVSPCAGTMRFVGSVAGSRPVLTVACASGGLLVTVGGAAPQVDVGALVLRGTRIGLVTGSSLTLSVRRPGVGYIDPLPLLRARVPWSPPAVGAARWSGRMPGHLRAAPAQRLPVVRLDRSLRTVVPGHANPDAHPEPDRWVGGIGAIIGLSAAGWAAARHRRLRIAAPRPAAVRR